MAAAINNELSYDQLVVIAESEFKLDYKFVIVGEDARGDGEIVQTLKVENTEWEMSFQHCEPERDHDEDFTWNYKEEKCIWLRCKDVEESRIDQAHLEVLLYRFRYGWNEDYDMIETPRRHKFTVDSNEMSFSITQQPIQLFASPYEKKLLFTLRLLQDRASLPDFTKLTTKIGRFPADIGLRVGDRIFHVNKRLLSVHSEYFDQMFNGNNGCYKEANQAEIELKPEGLCDPELFHDFLLTMFENNALPNSKNVVDLFKLAQYYQVETVTKKCQDHLRRECHEMSDEERILLAGEYGDEELQAFILRNVAISKNSRHIIATLFNKKFAPYGQQQEEQIWFAPYVQQQEEQFSLEF